VGFCGVYLCRNIPFTWLQPVITSLLFPGDHSGKPQDGRYGQKQSQVGLLAYRLRCESPGSALADGAHPSLAPPDAAVPIEWNGIIREFLSAAGLTQAVRGLDADMVVMNPIFERDVVPGALDNLLDSLVVSYTFRPTAIRNASPSLMIPDR
jgi:hypothetical protein